MPKIEIKEIDATTGGGSTGVVDIAYVPGFRVGATYTEAWPTSYDDVKQKEVADISQAAPIKEPILCETIDEFERYFGKVPASVKSDADGVKQSITYGQLISVFDLNSVVSSDSAYQAFIDVKFTDVDLSYIYAKELIKLGIPVLYEAVAVIEKDDASTNKVAIGLVAADILALYTYLEDGESGPFKRLEERGEFDVKYLTTGGYPNFEAHAPESAPTTPTPTPVAEEGEEPSTETPTETPESSTDIITLMRTCAKTRGDCVAFIDHINFPSRDLIGASSFYGKLIGNFSDSGEGSTANSFMTAFTPWVNITTTTLKNNDVYSMPGSYAYLSALGQSIQTNANWLAIAGAARGSIPNLAGPKPLCVDKTLTNTIAEQEYQNRDSVSINAITNIKPFGYRIWGNRTLKDNSAEQNLTATSFLNIRNLVSDVKKIVYQACRKYTFEQNNDILWTNFKAYIEPTLEKMVTGAGLSGYKIIKGVADEKAKLVATVKLYPVYAVEDFVITVVMEDDEISVN